MAYIMGDKLEQPVGSFMYRERWPVLNGVNDLFRNGWLLVPLQPLTNQPRSESSLLSVGQMDYV